MTNKKTKNPRADAAREIEEFKGSEYFKTLNGAEQDRAINEIQRDAEVRARNFVRPLWKNFFRKVPSESFVTEDIWLKCRTGQDTEQIQKGDHPLVSGYGTPAAIAIAAGQDYGARHLLQNLEDIDRWIERAMMEGNPKTANDLTTRHLALLELEEQLQWIKSDIERAICSHETVASALSFGALLMRLSVVFPEGGDEVGLQMIADMRKAYLETLNDMKRKQTAKDPNYDFIFRRSGGSGSLWEIRFDGVDLPPVPDSKGMAQICRLLSKRMNMVPARELHGVSDPPPPEAIKDNAGELDSTDGTEWSREYVYANPHKARKGMQDRLAEIEAEQNEPSTSLEDRDELEVEKVKLTKAIKAINATIKTGGPQLARDSKRTAVKGTIARAISMIRKTTNSDKMARHLSNMIETGTTCTYKGDNEWLTE